MALALAAACSSPAEQPRAAAPPAGPGAAGPGQPDSGVPGPSPLPVDPALLEPLTALGPCPDPPPSPAPDLEPVDGLSLPDSAVLTSTTASGPIAEVQGYVPMTPVQLRVHYQTHPTLEVVLIEDEIRESESLVTDGTYRLFVKAQAVCELGSVFVAVVAPESEAQAVPVPTGPAGG